MNAAVAIARREIGSFLRSAMAPALLTGVLFLLGYLFTNAVLTYSDISRLALTEGRGAAGLNLTEGVFQPLVMALYFVLLMVMPAVTMRLLSGEYRSRRYELIASYPVPEHGWVIGKWLSAVLVAGVLILAATLYFVVVVLLGKPELGPVVAALLGLLLMSAALAAWGVFFSSLFEYQLVAYMLTFGFSLTLYLLAGLEPFLPGVFGRLAEELSLQPHLERFSRGVIEGRDVLYLVSLTVLGLYLATGSLAGRRQAAGRRFLRSLPAVALVVTLAALQVLALTFPLRADLTANRRYSLAPQTLQILDALGDPQRLAADAPDVPATNLDLVGRDVQVYAFYQDIDPDRRAMEVLLRAFNDRSRRFRYRVVDPELELELVQRFGVTLARTVVVTVGDDFTSLLQPNESALINAVYRLISSTRPVVYHLTGHGEHLIDSNERPGYTAVADLLAEQGYDVRPLALTSRPVVPGDAAVLVMAGPKLDPSAAELAGIDEFLRNGGSVLALVDPVTSPAVVQWLRQYNVRLGEDVIISINALNRDFGVGARTLIVIDGYGAHPITRGLDRVATLFPLVQSMSRVQERMAGIDGKIILFSDPASWSERDPDTRFTGKAMPDSGVDYPGPLPFGVALTIRDDSAADAAPGMPIAADQAGTAEQDGDPDQASNPDQASDSRESRSIFDTEMVGRLVVVGNSEFASNANLHQYGNRDLVLNMLGWLAKEEILINLRGRDPLVQPVVLTTRQTEWIGWGCIVVWPLLVGCISLGFVLWHRRR